MSKLLFIHGGEKLKFDNQSNKYTDGSYSQEIWDRYFKIANEITVMFRKDKKIYSKKELEKKFNKLDDKIDFKELINLEENFNSFLSLKKRKANRDAIKQEVLNSDYIIARVPCPYSNIAIKYANKYNKKLLVEVVGCAFDIYKNQGIKGKILAIPYTISMKKNVSKSKNVMYVSNCFLQKRYPNKNNNIGCSDVSIEQININDFKSKLDNINLSKIRIGTIGSLDVRYKGQEYVIRALHKLKKQGINNIEYEIVGDGEGRYLKELVEKLDLKDEVLFKGSIPHKSIKNWIDKLTIYIQPSNTEGLCRSIIEAMSRGCACIVSDVGGNTELIDRDYIFKHKNVRDLERKIKRIINYKNLQNQMNINYNNSNDFLSYCLEKKRNDFYMKLIGNNETKKVLIVNGWSDLNSGDSGIVIAKIDRIYKKYKNCEITILSELHSKNEYYDSSIVYIKKKYPKIKLVPAIFYKRANPNIYDKIKEILSFFWCIIIEHFPIKIFKIIFRNNLYFNTIMNSDIIISKGGHFFTEFPGLHGIVHIKKCAYPLEIANKMGKNYYLISQSFGPIYSKKISSKIIMRTTKRVISYASGVSVRESESYKFLKENNFDITRTNETSDYAFKLQKSSGLSNELLNITKRGDFIVITLRQHRFKTKTGFNEYLETINDISNKIIEKYNYNIVFVPHVQGPNCFEDDRIVLNIFKSKYKNKKFIFTKEFYDAETLKLFYSKSKLLIGTRFHSVIFALGSYVPCIAISYSGFKANILKQFDFEKFLYDINDINLENEDALLNSIYELLDNNDKYRKHINEKFKNVNQLIDNDNAFILAFK